MYWDRPCTVHTHYRLGGQSADLPPAAVVPVYTVLVECDGTGFSQHVSHKVDNHCLLDANLNAA